jgi:hypothetical protein
MSFNITQPVKVVNPNSNVDSDYGTYADVAAANLAIPQAVREKGKTVGIIDGLTGSVVEYWYKSGITDLDLIPKVPRGVDILTESSTSIVYSVSMELASGSTIKETLERSFGNTIYLNNEKVNVFNPANLVVTPNPATTSLNSGIIRFTGSPLVAASGTVLLQIDNPLSSWTTDAVWVTMKISGGGLAYIRYYNNTPNMIVIDIVNLDTVNAITQIDINFMDMSKGV